jgi:hypothetical protein
MTFLAPPQISAKTAIALAVACWCLLGFVVTRVAHTEPPSDARLVGHVGRMPIRAVDDTLRRVSCYFLAHTSALRCVPWGAY